MNFGQSHLSLAHLSSRGAYALLLYGSCIVSEAQPQGKVVNHEIKIHENSSFLPHVRWTMFMPEYYTEYREYDSPAYRPLDG